MRETEKKEFDSMQILYGAEDIIRYECVLVENQQMWSHDVEQSRTDEEVNRWLRMIYQKHIYTFLMYNFVKLLRFSCFLFILKHNSKARYLVTLSILLSYVFSWLFNFPVCKIPCVSQVSKKRIGSYVNTMIRNEK